MKYTINFKGRCYDFKDLKTLLAKASPLRAADELAYQSTSFHDALYLRRVLGLRPAPEFEAWLNRLGIFDGHNSLSRGAAPPQLLGAMKELL